MTPNLRYNKKLTRKLLDASPKEKDRVSLLSINWNLENSDRIYGLEKMGWFKTTAFFLQKVDDDRYRLVVSDGSPLCGFYIIDDIERFIEFIGIQVLETMEESRDTLKEALEKSKDFPNTGIIVIDDDKVFVYEHCNY